MIRILTATGFSIALAASAFAQSGNPAWVDALTADAASSIQCEVSMLLSMKESELGGQKTYEARVRCLDGRTFDASRIGDFEPFTFKECNIQVC